MPTNTSRDDAAPYAGQFAAHIAAGTDHALPVYGLHRVRFVPVSEFLGEPHKAAQALLFRACHEAAAGNSLMAVELLKAFSKEVASEYGVTTAEAVALISDPDELRERFAAPVVLTAEQVGAMDEMAFGRVAA